MVWWERYKIAGKEGKRYADICSRILLKGKYKEDALRKWSRHDDINGPPRIGNVHLNSSHLEAFLGRKVAQWNY